jgi:hypothetical protein
MAYNLRSRVVTTQAKTQANKVTQAKTQANKATPSSTFTMVLRSSVSKGQKEILDCAKTLVSLRHSYFLRSK